MRQPILVYLIFASSVYAFDISPLRPSIVIQNVPVAVTWTRANDDPTGIALVKSISGESFSDSPQSTVLLNLANGQMDGVVQVTFFEADTFFLQAVQTSQNGSPARTFFTDHQTITVLPSALQTQVLGTSTTRIATIPRTPTTPETNSPPPSSPDETPTNPTTPSPSSVTETEIDSSAEISNDPTESQTSSGVSSPSLSSPSVMASTTPPVASIQDSSARPNAGLIAGSTVGSIVSVTVIGFLLWWYRRGMRRRGPRTWIVHPFVDTPDRDESKANTDTREEPVREERIRWHSDSGWRPTRDENEAGIIDMPPEYEEAR